MKAEFGMLKSPSSHGRHPAAGIAATSSRPCLFVPVEVPTPLLGSQPRIVRDEVRREHRPQFTQNIRPHPATDVTPKRGVISTEDHAVPTAAQKFEARRVGAPISYTRSGHDVPAISPGAVDRAIVAAANSVH